MSLAGKKVLVTGATGFLGGHLTKRLSDEGAMVRALVRRANRDTYIRDLPNVELITGDLTNPLHLGEAVQGCDLVFHVGAALGGSYADQLAVNVGGTHHLALQASQAGVEHFVHISSIAVYGYRYQSGYITEDMPHGTGNVAYNNTKSQAENALIAIANQHSLTYSIVRPGMIYGARSGAWTDKLFWLARQQRVPFIGDGSGIAHTTYVDDVVDLIVTVSTHPQAQNQAFNCVDDPEPTWRELLGAYMALVDNDRWLAIPPVIATTIAPVLDGILTLRGEPQDIRDIIPYALSPVRVSMVKARDLLGWSPQVSLHEGIARCKPYLQAKGWL